MTRKSKVTQSVPMSNARKITFQGNGVELRLARDLPINAPGLQW